jgi:hypothetical protein
MVNYNDPATIAQDYGAYRSVRYSVGVRDLQRDLPVDIFNRGGCEALALRGWCIYVSLRVLLR